MPMLPQHIRVLSVALVVSVGSALRFEPLLAHRASRRCVGVCASLQTDSDKPFTAERVAQDSRTAAEHANPADEHNAAERIVASVPSPLFLVLGPLLSCVLTIAFVFMTLLQSGSVSDTFASMDINEKLSVLSRVSWFPGRYEEAQIVVGLVMAFSAFAQALTGFGFAIVSVGALSSMPWLLHSELYSVITPVAATLGALVGSILLLPNARNLEWAEILPLLIPCTVLTPVGIALSSAVDPLVATKCLAVLILAFVTYKLKGGDDTPPEALSSTAAAYGFGAAAGIFGGAFDVQGPPLVVYGNAKGWDPRQFRDNVLTVVALNSALVVALDYFNGALGSFYYSYFCITSLPGVLVGVVLGQAASERIDPVLFKNVVLVMCLGLGLQLLLVS